MLFNRFYQPDVDLGQLTLSTDLQLSQPNEIRLPLLWLNPASWFAAMAGYPVDEMAADQQPGEHGD